MKEFARIAKYLAPLTSREGLGLTDDAALIPGPGSMDWAVTKDAIVEGVHFLPRTEPGLIAQKLLRTNLSDMAAMGAEPQFYLIAAALPTGISDAWYRGFTNALKREQKRWRIALIGGDTVRTSGPLTLSLTMIGSVPRGRALLRSGAKAGDAVYVSGTLGDAALGLRLLLPLPSGEGRGEGALTRASGAPSPEGRGFINRYHIPEPRVELGLALRGIASSCMDISDGLLQDMGHICDCCSVAATLYAEALPRREGVSVELAATGGDDYELLFTVPKGKEKQLPSLVKKLSLPLTRIGEIGKGKGVRLLDENEKTLRFTMQGWEHH